MNPNITSSHLFRADVLWDSEKDASFNPSAICDDNIDLSSFIKHMKPNYCPLKMTVKSFELERTIVRQLVPRNPQLDKPLGQTCHFFTSTANRRQAESFCTNDIGTTDSGANTDEDQTLVVYLPHAGTEAEVPFYHPPLRALAFLHSPQSSTPTGDESRATVSIHFSPFSSTALPVPLVDDPSSKSPDSSTSHISSRTHRTLTKLLETIHKHATTEIAGYTKRVHHDRIIPQKRSQDTYTRLKSKYAKVLIDKYWQEQTDVIKSIFEDLGIAAFLIELWRDMYDIPPRISDGPLHDCGIQTAGASTTNASGGSSKPCHPGFIDLACGNGVLVFILLSEGYGGWGFDARKRRTWAAFPSAIRANLHEAVLIPSLLDPSVHRVDRPAADKDNPAQAPLPPAPPLATDSESHASPKQPKIPLPRILDGIFTPGTFLISNHADELTPWTPLLAYTTNSPFIAIPCCSHDFGGAKTRYPARFAAGDGHDDDGYEPTQAHAQSRTGSLHNKPPSAYATLTGFVEDLTRRLSGTPEKEVLRIPSTRNGCVVSRRGWEDGRRMGNKDGVVDDEGDGSDEGNRWDGAKNTGYGRGEGGEDRVSTAGGDEFDPAHSQPPARSKTAQFASSSTRHSATEPNETSKEDEILKAEIIPHGQLSSDEKARRKQIVQDIIETEIKAPLSQVAESFQQRAFGLHAGKGRGH